MILSYFHLIVALISLIPFFIFLSCKRRLDAAPRQPPSPRKLPLIGNLHQLGTYPHRSLQSLSKRYGELMLLHFGFVPVLVVSSANAAREIMKNQDLVFSNRPKLSIPDKIFYGSKDVAFAPYGEYWRQVRSISVLHLLNNKMVQSFRRVREEETSVMIEKIKEMGCSSSSSSVVNLSDVLVSVTNDVVCRMALGRKYGDGDRKNFKILFEEFVELLGTSSMGDYFPWLSWVDRLSGLDERVEKLTKQFDEFLEGVIEEHRVEERKANNSMPCDDEGVDVDFVHILLEFQKENKVTSPFEDDVIKALILDMFAAGTDTTYTALEWATTELIRHPEIMKKLQNEVSEVAKWKEEITEDDLEKMPYLEAVMKESLRLHAPVPLLVPRESTQASNIFGYDVAAGTRVLINAWAIARDPIVWENPEEFDPERFLNDTRSSRIDYKGLHFELIPFGAGRRGCPGVTFAMSVNELALAKLVHKFNFSLANGEKPEDLDVSEANGLAVHKRLPLLVVATLTN